MTAEELLRIPDDCYRFRSELVRGELRIYPLADSEHGYITMQVGSRLAEYVESNELGVVYAAGTGFQIGFNPDTVRAPDVSFLRQNRIAEVGDVEGYWPGAPDLAVEVISPSDAYSDVEDKVLDWLGAGCLMVLVVDPRRETVTVYRSRTNIVILTRDEGLDGGDAVPGWSLDLHELFS